MPIQQSLHRRFTALMVLVALLCTVAISFSAYQFEYRRAIADSHATVDAMVMAIEKSAAIAAYTRDETLANELTVGLERNPQVRLARIHFDGVAAAPSPDGLTATWQLHSPFDPQEVVGRLEVQSNAGYLATRARVRALQQALWMALLTALIALCLSIAANRFVSRPIVKLAYQMRQLTPGTAQRLETPPGHQHDELGVLVTSSNELLQANEQALARERGLRAEVEQMEAQYRQIFDSTSAGIFVLDAQGRLINSNPTVMRLVGGDMLSWQGLRGGDFVAAVFKDVDAAWSLIKRAREYGETMSADLELVEGNHGVRWVHCLISVQQPSAADPAREPNALVEGVVYDITERHAAELVIRHRADHDALTGLRNRQASEATIQRFINDATRDGHAVTVMLVDLDGFKQINDTYGHLTGDLVLQKCAKRMQRAIRRSTDLVGRLGGDEFIIALYDCSSDNPLVVRTATKLLASLAEPIERDAGNLQISASIGIASTREIGYQLDALMAAADAAMYEVKHSGKNGYTVAKPAWQQMPKAAS